MKPVTLIDYPIDYQYLINLAESMRESSEGYNDQRLGNSKWDFWKIARFKDDPYVNKVMEDFGVQGKPRFYYLQANAVLAPHVDLNTTCSLNFILTDSEPAPVKVGGDNYYYRQCVLNTTVLHSVNNGPKERLLFKISLFDEPYESVVNRIPYKLPTIED